MKQGRTHLASLLFTDYSRRKTCPKQICQLVKPASRKCKIVGGGYCPFTLENPESNEQVYVLYENGKFAVCFSFSELFRFITKKMPELFSPSDPLDILALVCPITRIKFTESMVLRLIYIAYYKLKKPLKGLWVNFVPEKSIMTQHFLTAARIIYVYESSDSDADEYTDMETGTDNE